MATFVVGFGNRGFFPPEYMSEARRELPEVLEGLGHETILMDESITRLGAVETRDEGDRFAEFLETHVGRYDGIIWSHPNFGDEVGMKRALGTAGKRGDKILLHAYPDDMSKMSPDERRDSFCGVVSTMDVLYQMGIPFVKLPPHVISPHSPRFAENIAAFARICAGESVETFDLIDPVPSTDGENILDGMILLALGARTSPFYTTRFNELDAERNGITVETADLSMVFHRMDELDPANESYQKKAESLKTYTSWDRVPEKAFDQQVRLAVVVDEYIEEFHPDALAIRCWTEFEEIRNIAPCATLSLVNHRGIPMACEVDLGNAIAMAVMRRFSNDAVACQDWNNNWYEEENKFCFMHCGPHQTEWLKPNHYVDTHGILDHAFGKGTGFGCIQGRFAPTDFTYGSCSTENGKLKFCFGEGRVTEDELPANFFGAGGVGEIEGLQDVMSHVGYAGYKHHFSMTRGHVADEVIAALSGHPGFEVTDLREYARR
jgi:L-fucose isomerase-like protein